MGILPKSSTTLTWCANTAVNILMGVKYERAGLTSLLECEGGITGVGWPTLTSSMLENIISTQNYFRQKLNGAIFKRQISGGGDNFAAASGIAAAVAVVVWQLCYSKRNSEDSGAATAIDPQWKNGAVAAAMELRRKYLSGRLPGGGDNLAAAAGIAAAVVVVAWRLRRGAAAAVAVAALRAQW